MALRGSAAADIVAAAQAAHKVPPHEGAPTGYGAMHAAAGPFRVPAPCPCAQPHLRVCRPAVGCRHPRLHGEGWRLAADIAVAVHASRPMPGANAIVASRGCRPDR